MGDSALNTAVSALKAQSSALSVISQNLANSSTTGYKTIETQFYDLVVQQTYNTSLLSGGVSTITRQSLDTQGNLQTASSNTDLGINGKGFFAVDDGLSGTSTYYTRDGAFDTNSSGYLVLSGTDYYLMGWATDAEGNITGTTGSTASLERINVDKYNTSATATSSISLSANLPAEAQSDTSTYSAGFSTTLTLYDSLGTAQYVSVDFVPDGSNTWTMNVSQPTNAAGTATTGTLASGSESYTVSFNSDGSFSSITGGTLDSSGNPELDISGWTDGASSSTVSLDLGSSGSTSYLTQYDSGETTPTIDIKSTTNNGVAYGQMESVSIDSSGTVAVKYSNGQTVDIYKIPIVTFPNDNGLKAMSDNIYEQTSASGNYVLNVAGNNGAGTIDSGTLEASTVDTSTEFSGMIVAQQAYSAASEIISTDKQMYQSLISVMQ